MERLRRRSREGLRLLGGVGVLLRVLFPSRLRDRRLGFSTDFDLLRDFLRFSLDRLLFLEVERLLRDLFREPLRRLRSLERERRRRSRDLKWSHTESTSPGPTNPHRDP